MALRGILGTLRVHNMGYEVYRYIRIPGLRAHSRGPCFRPLDIGRVQGLGLIVKEVWEPQPSQI